MSWQPHKTKRGKYFDGGSSLHKILEDKFGSFPIVLSENDIEFLQGVEACGNGGVGDLVSALYEYGTIKIEAEW